MTLHRDEKTGLHLPPSVQPRDAKPMERWQCRRGHVLTAPKPYRMEMVIDGEVVYETRAICPRCFGEWIEKQFRADKVVALPEDTTAKQRDRRRRK